MKTLTKAELLDKLAQKDKEYEQLYKDTLGKVALIADLGSKNSDLTQRVGRLHRLIKDTQLAIRVFGEIHTPNLLSVSKGYYDENDIFHGGTWDTEPSSHLLRLIYGDLERGEKI